MLRPMGVFLLFFFILLFGLLPLSAAVYYVDAHNGDDVSGDGSSENPWKTVTFGLSQVNGPFCAIFVRPGVYDPGLGEVFPLRMKPGIVVQGAVSGESILRADNPDVNVVEFPDTISFGFNDGLKTLALEGGRCGVEIFSTGIATQPRIFNCSVRNNALDGVRLSADNGGLNFAMVHKNKIYGNGQWGVSVVVQGMSHTGFQIHGNSIYENGAGGIGIFMQEVCSVQGGAVMNKIYANNGDGLFLYCNGSRASATFSLQTNMIYDNAGCGVNLLGDNDGAADPNIVDNTIAFQGQYGMWVEVLNHATTETVVANNIFWRNAVDLGGRLSTGMVSHCLVSDGTFVGHSSNINGDPLFVDEEARDFHLQLGSPAIDVGDNNAPGGC